jgi:DedD protein
MFNFRFGGQGGSSPTELTSIETVRRRARHRLIGATLLVLAGVIGFPLLFESQPRPVQADFEIEIPSSKTAQPLPSAVPAAPGDGQHGLDEKEELVASAPSAAPAAPVPTASTPPAPALAAAPVQSVPAPPVTSPQVLPAAKPAEQALASVKPAEPRPADKPAEKPPAKPADKTADKPAERKPAESKPAPKADDAARALALLEGRPTPQADKASSGAEPGAAKSRFIVQVGAFVDPALAQQARQKLESSGLTTYTQISNTPDGPRTRVRLGPFATRAEAQKAADKARATGLSASILTL